DVKASRKGGSSSGKNDHTHSFRPVQFVEYLPKFLQSQWLDNIQLFWLVQPDPRDWTCGFQLAGSIFKIQSPKLQYQKNKMSLPNLAAGQGQIGGWEFATLSFPCWLLGASFLGLPASRRYSPRQAESPAS